MSQHKPFGLSPHSYRCSVALFVAAALFRCCTEASADGKPKKIVAFAGEAVILPCSLTPGDHSPEVEWSKKGPSPKIAFVYRNGCETFEMKHPDFHFRTHLFLKELQRGNMSLRISNLQPADVGTYECKNLLTKPPQVISTLELVLAAFPEPKLSAAPGEDGGLTVQCEVEWCWPSLPEMVLLDDQGKEISAEEPKRHPLTRECYTITRGVTAANSVTCRVHLSEINKTRETKIYIPENSMASCTEKIAIAVAGTIMCGLVCVIAAVLYRIYGPCVERPKVPVSSSGTCSAAEPPRQVNQADLDKIAELTTTIKNKDDIIRNQAADLNVFRSKEILGRQRSRSGIDSESPPDVSSPVNRPPRDSDPKPAASTSNNRPKPDSLPPRKKDPKPVASGQGPPPGPQTGTSTDDSCPSRTPPVIAAPPTSEKPCSRASSFSEPRRSGPRSPRRHTMSISNRYSVLGNLKEDSEPLI